MEVEISLNKSVDENAGTFFNLAKKAKNKLEGAKKALTESNKKLEKLKKEEDKHLVEKEKKERKKLRKKEWYEKFHWFVSSEEFLCVGGKDATSNEIIVKKHADKDDLVFHTEMRGSPFFVIKNGQSSTEKSQQEAAQATAVYSRAWKRGFTTTEVYSMTPEQIKKEFGLPKGSFMVHGKRTYFQPKLEYAIGLVNAQKSGISDSEEIIGGPISAIKEKTNNYVKVVPGRSKKSSLAKKIKAKLKGGDLDEIIKFLPAGGCELKK